MSLWKTTRTWGEMIKFSHSIFALPFALIALMWAGATLPAGRPAVGQIALVITCMVAARSFAMTFNRIVDAAIDARNPRTAGRALPAERISRGQAWAFLIACGAAFLTGCGGFLAYENPWPMRLGGPVLAALAGYSYTKRFTSLSHFVLGGAIALAPTATWIAINPATLGWPVVMLTGAVALWIAGFDILYACQDIEFDRREGLFSLPARIGPAAALWCSRASHAGTIALLVAVGRWMDRGPAYWVGTGIVALLLIFEQRLVRPNDFSKITLAFFTVNGVVSVVFALAVFADLWLAQR
ncbi:MAG: putative 4-hydroxybenzoate polyprenyltransferase [Phycisphaerae bacterium]|nr:putative 4-hydroxybenzoate polyprenyltransferase [Phycisphaerae bacterium]